MPTSTKFKNVPIGTILRLVSKYDNEPWVYVVIDHDVSFDILRRLDEFEPNAHRVAVKEIIQDQDAYKSLGGPRWEIVT